MSSGKTNTDVMLLLAGGRAASQADKQAGCKRVHVAAGMEMEYQRIGAMQRSIQGEDKLTSGEVKGTQPVRATQTACGQATGSLVRRPQAVRGCVLAA